MTHHPRRLLVLLLALLLLVASGCDNDDEDGGNGNAADRTTTTADDADGDSDGPTTTDAIGATTTTGGGANTTTPAPAEDEGEGVIELVITDGNVEGGVRREQVKQGSQVTLRTTSDVADELHLHGYDKRIDLVPGQSADLTFLANIPGVFEVELEGRQKKVLELEVRP